MSWSIKPEDERVCILGMGYVGLTLAIAMADRGYDVWGIEINQEILAKLRQGRGHFYEVNLDTMMRRNLEAGRLHFSDTIPDIEFDVYVVTVGTPLDAEGRPRMDMVTGVVDQVAGHMAPGALVVLRSTVRIGTTAEVVRPRLDATGKPYHLAFCPERTIEGKALEELFSLPQIVGGDSPEASDRATTLFRRLTATIVRVSNPETAELIKLLDNSFRDLFFAFGNEVAMICSHVGVSGRELIAAANMGYERTNIAQPGFVGGPCLEKDPHILMDSIQPFGYEPTLIKAGRFLNERLVPTVYEQATSRFPDRDDLTITLMGLAFKGRPDTSDLRGSTAIRMIHTIREAMPDATIRGHDYIVDDAEIEKLGVVPVDDQAAFDGAELVLFMNNNKRYSWLDIEERARRMATPGLIYDVWNQFYPSINLPEGVEFRVFGS